ncbi:MAG TPA: peptide-methionine (S)-S-oxide reductase MsrA [Patescibacteria group bacterium]
MQAQTITLAGGCFWCTEAIFERLKGVKSVISGYSGGIVENPSYEAVCSGKTGHAEVIQIEFDPQILPLEKLLEIFWHLHDPTTLNRQGSDVGTQYRSAIFYNSPNQKAIAEKSKATHQKEFKGQIVTEIVPFVNFYKAEKYHQEFYNKQSFSPNKNEDYQYCQVVIGPKIQKLLAEFKSEVNN